MAERYADRASFRTVYIKEAHAEDEWQMDDNVEEDVCYAQPRTFDARLRIARDFARRFDYGIPVYVDGIDDAAKELYAGWPERLYVIGADGRIAYKGKPGPFGFDPGEVEDWLVAHPPAAGSS
jgi:type I thyroxine 5'-deiodinase